MNNALFYKKIKNEEVHMATMQIKSIDDQLYNALKIKAKADNRSLSQQVVMILKEYLSKPDPRLQHQTDEFLKLAGSWKNDESAEKIPDLTIINWTNSDV
jgi:hypothetical protein